MRRVETGLNARVLRDTSVSQEALKAALIAQREDGLSLSAALLSAKQCPEGELLPVLSGYFGLEYLSDTDALKVNVDAIDADLLADLPINYAKAHRVLPLSTQSDGSVRVVIADPETLSACDDLRTLYSREIRPVVTTSDAVMDLINRVYSKRASAVDLDEQDTFEADSEELVDIIDSTDEAPIIRWVNSLIFQAVKERASDIHIEPGEREVVVRYRIDGVLYEVRRANRNYLPSITARVKIMSGMNIAEKRLPQDGRIRRRIAGKDIDMRVATVPTARGERLTVRLLDQSAVVLDLEDIGMDEDLLRDMDAIIRRPNGLLLVTGPTGSGKTTTLYAGLSVINTPDKNILTIEDPVEYQLEGISQTQVNAKISLTFAGGLRSFLRHDPDVIMVGEIRDLETAEIAIQASLTGHLVFSTLHTNDAASAVTRLVDMNVEPFLVASSIVGILAQRLVRKICPHCRTASRLEDAEAGSLGLEKNEAATLMEVAHKRFQDRILPPKGMIFRPVGCAQCLETGYIGRVGIYELLKMDDRVRTLVLRSADASAIKKEAIAAGMHTLRMDGALKIFSGLTSIEEVMRVTQEDII